MTFPLGGERSIQLSYQGEKRGMSWVKEPGVYGSAPGKSSQIPVDDWDTTAHDCVRCGCHQSHRAGAQSANPG